jgi:hypothetical protein
MKKLTQEEINARVDAWYNQHAHRIPKGHTTTKPEFKEALKNDLYLAQSVMRTRATAWSFKLTSVSTMYRWADILSINVIRTGEILQEQRAKRNHQIVKLYETKKMDAKAIAHKMNMRAPTVYEVLQDRDKWRYYVPKRATTQEVSASDVLGVFNDLFIAKAVKTNRYGVVGY